jgi:hypothetical protein
MNNLDNKIKEWLELQSIIPRDTVDDWLSEWDDLTLDVQQQIHKMYLDFLANHKHKALEV